MKIDVSLVKQLVAAQFPEWADLPISPVEIHGHDNRTFRLGDKMGVRMPSGKRYAKHVGTEHEWLPKLEPHLPLPIPVPLGKGVPGLGYPWPWSINKWLDGEHASAERISDLPEFAIDVASFLNALQAADASGAPRPGKDNFFRGGELAVYDSEVRGCVDALTGEIDTQAVISIWERALKARWDRPPVWVHGDVAAGNLLVKDGRLCAVVDFGQLAAGDPSCDTTLAWTFFSESSRKKFRAKLNVDDRTWVRGRGWAIWKALLELQAHRTKDLQRAALAEGVIHDILAE